MLVSGNIFRQELKRDETMQSRIFGLVDNTHATATKLLDNAVVRDGGVDHGAKPMLCRRKEQVNASKWAPQSTADRLPSSFRRDTMADHTGDADP